jgi:hypothetical protein
MQTKSALLLTALGAVVLALGVVYGTGGRNQATQVAPGRLAFPGLAPKLAEAAKLELVHHGKTLVLDRRSTDPAALWGVAEQADYPAQQGKVRALLTGLTELRLDEPRTAQPSEYARLGVEDADAKDAGSTQVRVLDANGGVLAALIVGHERAAAHGPEHAVFVRRPSEAQAWLAAGDVTGTVDAQEWLDREIVNIDRAKVEQVVVTRGDATLNFGRKDKEWTLTAPAEHPKLDQFKVDEVGGGLESLMLQSVQRAPAPGTPLGKTVVTTGDGMTVTVTLSKAEKALWATFAAAGQDKAKAAAAALAAKVDGWAYELPTYKEESLAPTLDQIKAPEPGTTETGKPAMPAAPPPPAPAAK